MVANWFIALPVPAGPWFEALQPPPGVRLFGAGDLHLTVAFLGPVTPERALRAFAQTRDFPLPVTDVRLGRVEALGSRRRPSAFSALLNDGRSEVERALTATRTMFWEAAQARPDARPALAHVTLARPARRATMAEVKRATSWAIGLELGAPRCRLDRVALYTWSEDRSVSLFRSVAELPLCAAGCGPQA